MNPINMTIHELSERYAGKEVSPVEVTQAYLDRMEALDPKLNAFITPTPAAALEQAKAAEKAIARGEGGPLTGIPLAVKDIYCTRGVRTTCGSKILHNYIPPYDAHVVAKLREAGAVFLGKTNMDEFAMGSTNEHSAYGPARNPWNPEYVPGGSSGGSAAAVAARLCTGAVGTDTGGSIRQPAGHCGVVGLKPTYGRVSRFGMVAFASSLDQGGPIVQDVTDSAIIMNCIAGHDPSDSTSAPEPVPDYRRSLTVGIEGLKVGLPKEYFIEGLDSEVEKAVRGAVATLESLGAEVVEVSLPHTEYGVAAYYIVAPAEASSNLARYDGVKYGFREENSRDLSDMYLDTRSSGFGPEVTRRILLGTYVLSAGYYDAYYRKATQVRALIRRDFQEAFDRVDVLACPIAPAPPFKIGEKADDPLAMYLSDAFTLCINMAGIPGISIPCGRTSDGLPIGMQLLGGFFKEETLIKAAYNYELAGDYTYTKIEPPL